MQKCKMKNMKLELCDELEHLINIDDKFEKPTFVTLSNPNEDIANVVTLKAQTKDNPVALSFCPFCGEAIRFDSKEEVK